MISNTALKLEQLFREDQNKFLGPAKYNENPFEYFERSARKDIEIIRKKLNEWFYIYPSEHQKELKNSFKKHFDDSFYELFLHQLFLQLGFQVEIHPTIEKTNKKPDFLIKKDDLVIYIEAKVVTGKSKKEEALERKTNEILDHLNKIKSNNFFLHISQLDLKSIKQPGTKEIIQLVQKQLENADPDSIEKILTNSGLANLPTIKINNDDIELKIGLIPKKKSARGKNTRPIGILPSKAFWGGGEEKLRQAIDFKAKRYGKIEKPFIICINTHDIKTSDKIDVDIAIWGAKGLSNNKVFLNIEEKLEHFSDSIFVKNKKPRLKHLNGILITQVYPSSIPNAKYYFYENPFSEDDFEMGELGLDFNSAKKSFKNDVVGDNFDQIFGIGKNWLRD